MDPGKVQALMDALARPIFVHRMNYTTAMARHPLSERKRGASQRLVDKALEDIHKLVIAYVRDSG